MSTLRPRRALAGHRIESRDVECWRVECIGPPSADLGERPELRRNRTLSLWLKRLRDRPGSSQYRICRTSEINQY
jgi:hypothetical protein